VTSVICGSGEQSSPLDVGVNQLRQAQKPFWAWRRGDACAIADPPTAGKVTRAATSLADWRRPPESRYWHHRRIINGFVMPLRRASASTGIAHFHAVFAMPEIGRRCRMAIPVEKKISQQVNAIKM
jgi:hypothetical protein